MIEIRTPMGRWVAASEATALQYVNAIRKDLTVIAEGEKDKYINENRLRGTTVEELRSGAGDKKSAEQTGS